MSQAGHQLPPPPPGHASPALSTGYGSSTPSSPRFTYPPSPPTPTPTSAPSPAGEQPPHRQPSGGAGAASSSSSADMPGRSSSSSAAAAAELTKVERWAYRASDSQFNAVAGAIGGFTSGVVTCPLDVIKTKLQAQGGFTAVQKGRHVGHHKVYEGLVGTARVIWREEGVRGMYRGLGPIILGYLPTWAVWFTVYNKSKVWMGQHYHNGFVVNFWSSIIAGASSTIVTNPIWVIKTRLMSQTSNHGRTSFSVFPKGANTPTSRPTLHAPWHYRSTLDAARKMYTHEGILSFYSGLTPALLGLTHVAVQFPAYEFLKTKFTGKGMGDSPVEHGEERSHWFGVLSASIMSKILASSATYPHEVIRTRLQTQRRPSPGYDGLFGGGGAAARAGGGSSGTAPTQQQGSGGGTAQQGAQNSHVPRYRGVLMTFRTILREEGWRAFYAGMGTNMMRAVPAATVTMLTYEYVMQVLNKARFDSRQKIDGGGDMDGGQRAVGLV